MTFPEPGAVSWPQAARAVAEAVEVLAGVPTADLADAQLAEALHHAAVQASRLHAVAVRVTAEADSRRVWRAQGAASLRGWVSRCVQLADDGTRLVTAARMLAFMPKMAALFSAGHVSLAQMGTTARQVRRLPDLPARHDRSAADGAAPGDPPGGGAEPPGNPAVPGDAAGGADPVDGGQPVTAGARGCPDGDVAAAGLGDLRAAADDIFAGHAATAGARALAALGEHIYAAADPGDHLGEFLSRRERRHLSISRGFENMGEVSGRLDPEATERAMTVLAALSVKAGPGDHRTAGQRRADAFDTLCRNWLGSGDSPSAPVGPARRDRVIVTIPYPTLAGLACAAGAVLGNGIPIPAETARRLSCDAPIRRVVLTPPVSHGRCPCGHTCPPPTRSDITTQHGATTRAGAGTRDDLNSSSNSAKGGAQAEPDMSQRPVRHRKPGRAEVGRRLAEPGRAEVGCRPAEPGRRPAEAGIGGLGQRGPGHPD